MSKEDLKLTIEEAEDLLEIKNGADIASFFLAQRLRKIEQKYPEYIHICKTMNNYSVNVPLPYFGAIATEEGIKAAKQALKEETLNE